MSEHRTIVTARWPHVPLGTSIEVRVPDTYDIAGTAYEINEVAKELRKGTFAGRFIELLILPLLRKIGLISNA